MKKFFETVVHPCGAIGEEYNIKKNSGSKFLGGV